MTASTTARNYEIDIADIFNYRCPVEDCTHVGVDAGLCGCHTSAHGPTSCREHTGVGIYVDDSCPVSVGDDEMCGKDVAGWDDDGDVLIAVCAEHARWVRFEYGGVVYEAHPLANLVVIHLTRSWFAAERYFGHGLPRSRRTIA